MEKQQPFDLENMTVVDVLSHPLFERELSKNIGFYRTYISAGYKRNAAKTLAEKGVLLDSTKLINAYADLLDKRLDGFSSRERTLIEHIGTRTFNKVIRLMKEANAKHLKQLKDNNDDRT